jgi:predicted peptidase
MTVFAASAAFGQLPVESPGVHDRTFKLSGSPKTLRYAISVPKGYDGSRSVPLVLALHYGGSPNGAALGLMRQLVQPGLGELGAVIVAPETLGGPWSTSENEQAALALLDAVQATYRIDTRKTAVTGFSMGGAGTWHFAGKFPDRFRAAVPVAGRPPQSLEGWKIPVFAVHSRQDEVVPFAPAETALQTLQKAGVHARFVPLSGISHYETGRFADGLRQAVSWLQDLWE